MKNTRIPRHTRNKTGFSLVETLVAITILLLAIVVPMTIAARSLETAFFAKEQITAFYLASEGVELIRELRDEKALEGNTNPSQWLAKVNSACFSSNGCGLDARGTVKTSCTGKSCVLYYDSSGTGSGVGTYTHVSSGNVETPYTRKLKVTKVSSPANQEADIEASVSWTSQLFPVARTVTVHSRLFNQYDCLWGGPGCP